MSDYMAQKADDQIEAGLNEREELYAEIERLRAAIKELGESCIEVYPSDLSSWADKVLKGDKR